MRKRLLSALEPPIWLSPTELPCPGQCGLMKLQLAPVMRTTCSDLATHHKIVSARAYDDDHRATIFSGGTGEYSFESNLPPDYSGRPPHIHIRISAEGFKTLATQHYPDNGQTTGKFNIVLIPNE